MQDRETWRRVRTVTARSADGPVAELAVDAVIFDLESGDVRHHELEVETKADGAEPVVAELTERLEARFRPNLRRWRVGKLGTGAAVEALLEERDRDELLTADGTLRPSTYDAVISLLARERT